MSVAVGQLYFDQELIDAVEGMNPYKQNKYQLTYNVDDFLTSQQASSDHDPFMDYVMLSEDPDDGLLMWATIGINGTADYNALATPGAWYYKEGGVDRSPTFNFTPPPGGFPTGFPTGFPGGFPGFPTGFPGGFPFPPRPTGTPTKFWGPCMKKKRDAGSA